MRLGIIGSGSIVPYHLNALRYSGFNLCSIGSLPNSKSHQSIAASFHIENICANGWDVLNTDIDCVLIATPPALLWEYTESALQKDLFVLAEKPLLTGEENNLTYANPSNLMVGFNRRFYKSVQKMKELLKDKALDFFELDIYEFIDKEQPVKDFFGQTILNNSIHYIDLLRYILIEKFDLLTIPYTIEVSNNNDCIVLVFTDSQRYKGMIRIFFGYSGNNLLKLHSSQVVFELCPIETLSIYEGMSIAQPSVTSQVRTYSRNKILEVSDLYLDAEFKPGFLEQAREFSLMVSRLPFMRKSATLSEAREIVAFLVNINKRI